MIFETHVCTPSQYTQIQTEKSNFKYGLRTIEFHSSLKQLPDQPTSKAIIIKLQIVHAYIYFHYTSSNALQHFEQKGLRQHSTYQRTNTHKQILDEKLVSSLQLVIKPKNLNQQLTKENLYVNPLAKLCHYLFNSFFISYIHVQTICGSRNF